MDDQTAPASPAGPGPWRARVESDLLFDGVALHLRRRLDYEHVQVATPLTLSMGSLVVDEGTATMAEPMLRLPDDMARALLDALAAHYGDGHTWPTELAALNERLDKLINHVMGEPCV